MFISGDYRVYVADTDVAGVVHHSNYLRYFEAGRIEFLRNGPVSYNDIQQNGIGCVPYSIELAYHKPLRLDDCYQVAVRVEWVKQASFCMEQHIVCKDSQHATARVRLACVQEPAFKPIGIPKVLRSFLISHCDA